MPFFQLLKLPASIVFNYGHHESHLHSLLLSILSSSCFTWCYIVKKLLTEKHLELNPHYLFIFCLTWEYLVSLRLTYFLNTKQGLVLTASECDTGLKKKSIMARSLMTIKKKNTGSFMNLTFYWWLYHVLLLSIGLYGNVVPTSWPSVVPSFLPHLSS